MPDYTQGKIYMICSQKTDKVYIGSTTNTLNARFRRHIIGKRCSSVEIIDLGDAEIKLIHLCPCYTKKELTDQEGRVMRLFENRVNKQLEGQTDAEKKTHNIGRRLISNMTTEQQEARNKKQRVKNMTSEQREKKRERDKNRIREYKPQDKPITEEQRIKKRAYDKKYQAAKKAAQSV